MHLQLPISKDVVKLKPGSSWFKIQQIQTAALLQNMDTCIAHTQLKCVYKILFWKHEGRQHLRDPNEVANMRLWKKAEKTECLLLSTECRTNHNIRIAHNASTSMLAIKENMLILQYRKKCNNTKNINLKNCYWTVDKQMPKKQDVHPQLNRQLCLLNAYMVLNPNTKNTMGSTVQRQVQFCIL